MNVSEISPVSFGKIVKVKAPRNIAEEIVSMANGKGRKKLDKKVREIFNDVEYGKALNCVSDGENYILSGKDANVVDGYYGEMFSEIDFAHGYYNGGELAVIASNDAVEACSARISRFIGMAENKQTLNVDYDKETGKIKSMDLIA